LPTTPDLILLAIAALGAGFIDAVAGGGGLIQVPALLATLPGEAPATLFGTNKGSSVFGTLNAAWRYGRHIALPWRTLLLPASAAAFVFAFAGAAVVAWLPKDTVRPLVLALLIGVWLYTLLQPGFGKSSGRAPTHPLLPALAIGALIGFYDGFFGPGTGSFLIFAFVRVFGLDFLSASASAKFVNASTNIAALSYFIPHGQIIWPLVAVMAVCNIAGATLGSRLAIKHGSGFVRGVFLLVVGALIIKVTFDTLMH
jgi:uncharacterized membrane protein YfcA